MPKACPRAMLFPPTLAARDEGAALPFPPGTASSPCPARDVRPPPRVSALRGMIALWKPSLLSLPAASGQREGSQSACAVLLVACHCLPISRVLAVDRSTLPWLCCKPRLAEASSRPHLSYLAASHSACAAACSCPARSSRCCHPPPDPCHTLGQPLCARCGGDPPDLWSPLGSFPAAALLPIV